MPQPTQNNSTLVTYRGEIELGPDPDDWSPEDIMFLARDTPPSVEERIRRALAMYRFRLLSVQGLPVHNVVVARFSASDNIGGHLRSLAKVLSAALAHHNVSFDKNSASVSGEGRRGQLAFGLTEPFDGEWARD